MGRQVIFAFVAIALFLGVEGYIRCLHNTTAECHGTPCARLEETCGKETEQPKCREGCDMTKVECICGANYARNSTGSCILESDCN